MGPLARYEQDQKTENFQPDPAQLLAVKKLQSLYECMEAKKPAKRSSFFSFFSSAKKERAPEIGLYLWGGVGRGKTYLMDLFYDSLSSERKIRTHFHRFMRRVHHELDRLKGEKNPLELVAAVLADEADILCFDEFFVSEITDAMILANLFDALFARGVSLVATSNIPPERLYENGLQRDSFLPAIDLIQRYTEVHHLDGEMDHRLRALQQAQLYYHPLSDETETAMDSCFKRLTVHSEHEKIDGAVNVEGRDISFKREIDDVIWFDFAALCDGPRSQADYIVLAKEYHTVFISDVPQLEDKHDDQARRLIYLVDEFYDCGVKLIVSAAVEIPRLYVGRRLSFDVQRTYSRLLEMQSEEYLQRPHKA